MENHIKLKPGDQYIFTLEPQSSINLWPLQSSNNSQNQLVVSVISYYGEDSVNDITLSFKPENTNAKAIVREGRWALLPKNIELESKGVFTTTVLQNTAKQRIICGVQISVRGEATNLIAGNLQTIYLDSDLSSWKYKVT